MENRQLQRIPWNIYLFLALVAVFPLIDSVNGFFLTTGETFPIGILYRFAFFFFLLFAIFSKVMPKSRYTFLTFLFILGSFLLFLLQSIVLENPISHVTSDLGVLVKYFLWALIPYYMYQRRETFQILWLNRMFTVINLFFTAGLIIPYLLGVGTYTYAASEAGYKGFFYAQNDLSCAFIILITLSGWELHKKLQGKWRMGLILSLLLYAGNFFCLILIGMKTGILYGAFVSLILLVTVLFGSLYRSFLHRLTIWIICLGILLWGAIKGARDIVSMLSGTFERLSYFYHLYDGDLVRLLSSSRSTFLDGGMTAFLSDPHFYFTFFGGQGFQYRLEQFGRMGLIEMDFFDAFFGFGLIGMILLLVLLGYFLKLALEKEGRSVYSFILIVVIFYGFFAGHVLFSALSSTFLGLICGAVLITRKT
ncbi:O-antigen ligase family protein [Listeria aquatica]|uniref:O-antigen ligase family protein n=1 Tax=Listeria aquatica TaxID=1494960 RepID=UPI0031F4A3DE